VQEVAGTLNPNDPIPEFLTFERIYEQQYLVSKSFKLMFRPNPATNLIEATTFVPKEGQSKPENYSSYVVVPKTVAPQVSSSTTSSQTTSSSTSTTSQSTTAPEAATMAKPAPKPDLSVSTASSTRKPAPISPIKYPSITGQISTLVNTAGFSSLDNVSTVPISGRFEYDQVDV